MAYDILLSVSAPLISLFMVIMLERIIQFEVRACEHTHFYSNQNTPFIQFFIPCIYKDEILDMDSEGSQTTSVCDSVKENSSAFVHNNHIKLCEEHMLMLLTTNKGLFVIQLITRVRSGISDLHAMPRD